MHVMKRETELVKQIPDDKPQSLHLDANKEITWIKTELYNYSSRYLLTMILKINNIALIHNDIFPHSTS